MKTRFTENNLKDLYRALNEASRDQLAFADAYTPKHGKPSAEARRYIGDARSAVKRYGLLRKKIAGMIERSKKPERGDA